MSVGSLNADDPKEQLMPMLLELTDVHKTYGEFQAVTEMSFAITS